MTDFHHRPGVVGFRLLNELRGMLDGIRADGVIAGSELQRVQRWVAENREFAWIPPFSEVAEPLEQALADGELTLDEIEDVLFVIDNLTTVNPHFDAMRSGIQTLMGVLTGVAADGVIKPEEIAHLQYWIEQWGHLKGLWPFDECEAVVTAAIAHGRLADDARAILDLASTFPIAGGTPADPRAMLVQGICAVDPDVTFAEKAFVFTGDSDKGTREDLADHVISRSGLHHPKLRKDTDYLVVCDKGSPCWAFACYGRKVEQALAYRREGLPIVLVHERDFWDAVANVKATGVPAKRQATRRRARFDDGDVDSITIRVTFPTDLSAN